MAVNLVLRAKVILVLRSRVSSKVHCSLNMSDKDWLSRFHDFSLHFKSHVWINMVNYPDAIGISFSGSHASYLFGRDRGANCW